MTDLSLLEPPRSPGLGPRYQTMTPGVAQPGPRNVPNVDTDEQTHTLLIKTWRKSHLYKCILRF